MCECEYATNTGRPRSNSPPVNQETPSLMPESISRPSLDEIHRAAEGLREVIVHTPLVPYRDEVLPPAITARVSMESGVSLGWDRWVNQRDGAIIAIDRYGTSAPAPQIFEKFGLTVENMAEVARGVLSGDVRGVISPDADHAGATLEAAEAR